MAYFCWPECDQDFIINMGFSLKKLPTSWKWGIGTVGANVPEEVARIMHRARAVPVWDIAGLEHNRPVEAPVAPFPELLRQQLLASGAECLSDNLIKVTLLTKDSRSQMLYISTWNSKSFALMSPFADGIDGTYPEWLRGHSFDDYRIEVIGNMVMLVDLLPAGPPPPTIEDIISRGTALANYADRIEGDLSTMDKY